MQAVLAGTVQVVSSEGTINEVQPTTRSTSTRKKVAKAGRPEEASPAIALERAAAMAVLQAVTVLLRGVVGPNVEVVLHDLTQPESSVVAIVNGHVTGRTVGSSILEGPKDDKAFAHAIKQLQPGGASGATVVPEYPTTGPDGLPLRSDTVIFRDQTGAAFAALCINADLGIFEAAHTWLEKVLHRGNGVVPHGVESRHAVDSLMHEILRESVRTLGKPARQLNRREKIAAVEEMTKRGVFMVRGSVDQAASALGVTRFTIYNYLEEIRQRESNSST